MAAYWGTRQGVRPTKAIAARPTEVYKKYGAEALKRMAIYNQALPFLDPTSRGQIMRQMAQEMPELFGGYRAAPTPPPPPGMGPEARAYQESVLSPERLSQVIQAIDPASVVSALKGGKEMNPAKRRAAVRNLGETTGGGSNWLGDYLRTAQQAYGTGTQRMSRAQRAYAASRLGELEQRAQETGIGRDYMPLAQALVNPSLGQAPTSGGLGTFRSTATPQPKPRRGGSFAARALT